MVCTWLKIKITKVKSQGRNAGGRTSELTSELVKTCQKLIGIETCMHLTCTGMPREKVDTALRVSNIPHPLDAPVQTQSPLRSLLICLSFTGGEVAWLP